MRTIKEAFDSLDAQTVKESAKDIAAFKPDFESRVEIYNQLAQFLMDKLGGVFIFDYASDEDDGNWQSKYIQEVLVQKYNSTVWIFADVPAIEDLYKSDDKVGLEEFADGLADILCQEMEHKHIIKESVREARDYGQRNETFKIDGRLLKRKHVRPADTFREGDSLELINDGLTLEAEEPVAKMDRDTVNGGARQRAFSKKLTVYATDYGRLYIEVIYDSFNEKETIIVLSRDEYNSGKWKRDLDDDKLTEAYKYAVYIKAKDDESLPEWMKYDGSLDDTFNVSSKRELIDNLDALMIANADPDEIHYNVTHIAAVSKDGEHNDIDPKTLPRKYEMLFESTKLHESKDTITLQDFYQLSTPDAKQAFIDAIKASYDVHIGIDSFYKATSTESLYEPGESDDIDEEDNYVDFDVEYDVGDGKEEIHIEGFYNDYPKVTYVFDGQKTVKTLPKAANEIDFNCLVEMLVGDKFRLGKVKEDYEFYKKPNGKIGVDKVLQTTRRSGRIMHGDTSLDQACGFAKKRIPFEQMSAADKQAARAAFDELKDNGTLDKVAKEFNTSPRADVVPKASGDVADVYYDDNKTGTPDERIDLTESVLFSKLLKESK